MRFFFFHDRPLTTSLPFPPTSPSPPELPTTGRTRAPVKQTPSPRNVTLIQQGAKTVVVAGIAPLGCLPPNLELFPSADPADYDSRTGCLKQLNDLAVHHNSQLQAALKRSDNKGTNNSEHMLTTGFTRDVLKCCCGGGGKYNLSIGCGKPGATVCQDPSAYLFWDGHLTEAAYRHIAKGWLNSINSCKLWQ
ncbi:GDSL esterase/lipase [Dichanthelium oligosanthes]|uniref:GDSL esterase/lipase n=1 Tax=Dichanthelium oligosanthes TaxID=888268 RepID=A0A1E5VKZ4_9POAL|nr:GDSL esterase/lipase [Dichanthelium oligosanthes]